ncbi:TetR/AcrR family transcriptional regulator [Motiliproteus coralliicola]|uniref:TetR/AcrR family transcriptional regulator n=1 Tax=Motiliproteus coralliicola TaxID=2283196 RepID=UPI001FB5561D|nr:TetR/AcrR family transcriptional regulator [Motiliproteus coralliicola]
MSAKRMLLIETAFALFYCKGVHAVGINEVLAESGVAKKTLYHHFDSKDALIAAVVDYRDQRFLSWLESRFEAVQPGIAKIDALFDALDDWFNDRVTDLMPFHGCFFINVSGEFGEPDHPIHQQCARHKQRVAALIESQLLLQMSSPEECREICQTLCLLKEGAITQAHVQGDRDAALKAKKAALRLMER